VFSQLGELFRRIRPATAVAAISILFSKEPDSVEVRVVAEMISRVGRDELDLRGELPDELRQGLRQYLRSGISFATSQNDVRGELLANLASALARVGDHEDVADLARLIQADLKRLRDIRAAAATGQRIQGVMGYSTWQLNALISLDREQAESVLHTLLNEQEYETEAAKSLLRVATVEGSERRGLPPNKDYGLIWKAREGPIPGKFIEDRRERAAAALRAKVSALLAEQAASDEPERFSYRLQWLSVTLAALDARRSADLVLQCAMLPARWHGWRRVEALDALLFGGVNVSAEAAISILNLVIDEVRGDPYNDQNRWLRKACLCLLPFVDNPSLGIARLREAVVEAKLRDYELRDLITALGYSRSPDALAYLRDIAGSDATSIQQAFRPWVTAVASLGGPEARELLLSFVDPHSSSFSPRVKIENYDAELLASEIAAIAASEAETKRRVLALSDQDLPPEIHFLLWRVIARIGAPGDILAGLTMVRGPDRPAPYELWKAFENLFLEQRPSGDSDNSYTVVPRTSNEVRKALLEMVLSDEKRRHSAFVLLGRIELWRLENGKPDGEPRHPDLDSGVPWPPLDLLSGEPIQGVQKFETMSSTHRVYFPPA